MYRDWQPLCIIRGKAKGPRGLLLCFERLVLIHLDDHALVCCECWKTDEVPYPHVENKGTLLADWNLPWSALSRDSRTELLQGPEGFLPLWS